MKLSTAQKIVKVFTSKRKFEVMKLECSKWQFTCESCSEASSIWELGGIRYKSKGDKKTRIRCPKCQSVAFHVIIKNDIVK